MQVVVLLYNCFVTLNIEMNCARNYENLLLNFVKIMPKILVV